VATRSQNKSKKVKEQKAKTVDIVSSLFLVLVVGNHAV